MMNSFAKEAYALHYKGADIQDIRHFIENIVLGGSDYLLEKERLSLNPIWYLRISNQQRKI